MLAAWPGMGGPGAQTLARLPGGGEGVGFRVGGCRLWASCPPPSLQFGEHFEFDCKHCLCLEGGSGITCRPKTCAPEQRVECREDGTYPVREVDPLDTCCNVTSCSKAPAGQGVGASAARWLEAGPWLASAGEWVLGRLQDAAGAGRPHHGPARVFRVQRQPVQGAAPAVPAGLPSE